MFIKVEPTDFFMYLVKLIFDLDHPDSEDQQVRDYLNEYELEPKYQGTYQGTGEFEGSRCELMQFGGCYLGQHLEQIGRIQRHAVEVELLTAQIQLHLNGERPNAVSFPEEQRQAVIAALVQQFHQESSFKTGENGELIASLDSRVVREVARGLLSGAPGPWRAAPHVAGGGRWSFRGRIKGGSSLRYHGLERATGIEPT